MLHLNLAECYRKLGKPRAARAERNEAREGLGALPGGDGAATIRNGATELARSRDT